MSNKSRETNCLTILTAGATALSVWCFFAYLVWVIYERSSLS